MPTAKKTKTHITAATIFAIAFDVRDGTSNPDDVRRLLRFFCKTIEKQEPTPPELVRFIREAFRRYLSRKVNSLDKAFGLVRGKRGKPQSDRRKSIEIAAAVLRYRLAGKSYDRAVEETKREFRCSKTTVADAWRNHKNVALYLERNGRPITPYPWSDEEKAVLQEIFPLDERICDWTGIRHHAVQRIPRIRRT